MDSSGTSLGATVQPSTSDFIEIIEDQRGSALGRVTVSQELEEIRNGLGAHSEYLQGGNLGLQSDGRRFMGENVQG